MTTQPDTTTESFEITTPADAETADEAYFNRSDSYTRAEAELVTCTCGTYDDVEVDVLIGIVDASGTSIELALQD